MRGIGGLSWGSMGCLGMPAPSNRDHPMGCSQRTRITGIKGYGIGAHGTGRHSLDGKTGETVRWGDAGDGRGESERKRERKIGREIGRGGEKEEEEEM